MKLRHIYITKEGEPMGNPEMPLPLHFKEEFDYNQDDIEDHEDAMKKYHSGLLPFEDGHKAKLTISWEKGMPPPDTLIPVDLEVEVVRQKIAAHENSDKSWGPVVREGHKLFQYRKVLRIKN